jgi:adenylate cyclase class IV
MDRMLAALTGIIALMSSIEDEARYKVANTSDVIEILKRVGFSLRQQVDQIDHWFIPNEIMSVEEQAHWFDLEGGVAIRIREESEKVDEVKLELTAKSLAIPGDHASLRNVEGPLSFVTMNEVLKEIQKDGEIGVVGTDKEDTLTVAAAKLVLESAGRKEYLTIRKQRQNFGSESHPDVVVSVDIIPDLMPKLGFSSAIEIEYVGSSSNASSATIVRVCEEIGLSDSDTLEVGLPRLAVEYLAKFD